KEQGEDNEQVKAVFTITQRPSLLLKGGQALITFEEETVASQILRMAKCSVSCERSTINVKPKILILQPSVKFEVHIDVSKKTLKFSNAPPSIEEDRMKDRLEISFSRPSRGGGEVEGVEYDKTSGTGRITFLDTGVAENLALKRKYCVDLDREVDVNVGLVYDYRLRKFQSFCGSPKRTILLDDIEDTADEEDLQDFLEIHFQKSSNYGGEVESMKYISAGKSLKAFFIEDSSEAAD
ncbi:N-myc-interactor, partial [Aplochiton taeniatus]